MMAADSNLNAMRARFAHTALKRFAKSTSCDMGGEALRDLITDLGHWADRNGIAFEREVINAMLTWRREKAEEVLS